MEFFFHKIVPRWNTFHRIEGTGPIGFPLFVCFLLLLFLLPNGDGLVIGCFPIEFSPRFTGFLDAGLRMPARSQRSRTRRRPIEKERERERTKE